MSENERQAPGTERGGDDLLAMDAAEMRTLGYWVVDRVVEHLERLPGEPAIVTAAPDDLAAALGGPPPLEGGDPLEAMQTLVTVALAAMQHGDHPRYFARIPGPSSYPGVLGDWLATGFNAIASSWVGGSGVSALELVALDWLRALLGLPEGAEGLMTSGGSLANLTALAVARAAAGPGVCYLSDQTHASVARALSVLGFPPEHVRVLATGADLRLSPADLSAAIAADRSGGRRPGFVVATAGTTNTGAVDPLEELAGLCRAEGLWLHVDGAYGAAAALCAEGRRLLDGLDLADSVVVDPHKWLFQPYDLGCVFVRRAGALAQAFRMTPEYLVDASGAGEVDLRDRGPELTRKGRALKLWLTLKVYGARRLGAAVAHGIASAEQAERLIAADPAWRVVTPAQLAIVTFAPLEAGDDTCRALADRVAREGVAALTSTRLHGRPVLRLCTISPRTTSADVAATLAALGVRV